MADLDLPPEEPKPPITSALRQVDPKMWLIGNLLCCRYNGHNPQAQWNDPSSNSHYILKNGPRDYRGTRLRPNCPHVELLFVAGDESAVWAIGTNVLCKIRRIGRKTTLEARALEYVRRQKPGFRVPETLYDFDLNGLSYIFLEKLRGATLSRVWPTLDKKGEKFYVDRVVDIIKEMASWEGKAFGGVDCAEIPESDLAEKGDGEQDFSSWKLEKVCEEMGMDCSKFVFCHADLGPGNLIVEAGQVHVVNFDIAGFVPRAWIRTKFMVSRRLDFPPAIAEPGEWRERIAKTLGEAGFEECADAWKARFGQDDTNGSRQIGC